MINRSLTSLYDIILSVHELLRVANLPPQPTKIRLQAAATAFSAAPTFNGRRVCQYDTLVTAERNKYTANLSDVLPQREELLLYRIVGVK